MIALNLQCPKHPRYMAILAPRSVHVNGCVCVDLYRVAEWARRGSESSDSAQETVVRVERDLLHSLHAFASITSAEQK